MPPRKRTTPKADEAKAEMPSPPDGYATPTQERVTVEEMTAEETAQAEADWATAAHHAALAGLLGDVKAIDTQVHSLGERVAGIEGWIRPSDGPELVDELNALDRRLAAVERRPIAVEATPEAPAVYAAMWGVMNDVQGVGKHGQMDPAARMGNYRFRRYDDLKRELGAACRVHGIMVQSEIIDVANDRAFEDKRKVRVQIQMRYRFTSLVDGSAVAFESVGESIDTSDKASGKAMTMALKTALDQAFMLAAEDIEDPDAARPNEDDAPALRAAYERPRQFQRAPQDVHPGQVVRHDNGPERREPHPTQADLAAAQRALHAGEGPAGVMDAAQRGYPDNRPQNPADPWDGGPPDNRTPEQKAQAAADKASAPGLTMAQWSAISDAARQLGLYEVSVKVGGKTMALKHHLVAVGGTLA